MTEIGRWCLAMGVAFVLVGFTQFLAGFIAGAIYELKVMRLFAAIMKEAGISDVKQFRRSQAYRKRALRRSFYARAANRSGAASGIFSVDGTRGLG